MKTLKANYQCVASVVFDEAEFRDIFGHYLAPVSGHPTNSNFQSTEDR